MVNPIEILLVEDSPTDAKLTIRSLEKSNIANRITHLLDGAIALDYLFCEGIYKDRDHATDPRVVLLDIKLPKVHGLGSLLRLRHAPTTRPRQRLQPIGRDPLRSFPTTGNPALLTQG